MWQKECRGVDQCRHTAAGTRSGAQLRYAAERLGWYTGPWGARAAAPPRMSCYRGSPSCCWPRHARTWTPCGRRPPGKPPARARGAGVRGRLRGCCCRLLLLLSMQSVHGLRGRHDKVWERLSFLCLVCVERAEALLAQRPDTWRAERHSAQDVGARRHSGRRRQGARPGAAWCPDANPTLNPAAATQGRTSMLGRKSGVPSGAGSQGDVPASSSPV